MYQHKIHIYSLQYMRNGKKRKVVQIKVIYALQMPQNVLRNEETYS